MRVLLVFGEYFIVNSLISLILKREKTFEIIIL